MMSPGRTPDGGALQIDAELERRVELFARARGITPTIVLREAFNEYEAKHNGEPRTAVAEEGESLYDAMNRLGLIGCIDDPGLPPDLSTNPKYMEGFGRD